MVDTLHMGIEGIDTAQFVWQKSANCTKVPSYVFFPEEQMHPRFKPNPSFKNVTYKDFCGECRVRRICLDFSLLHDLSGIWGGLTEIERKNRFSPFEREEMREIKGDLGKYQSLYGHS